MISQFSRRFLPVRFTCAAFAVSPSAQSAHQQGENDTADLLRYWLLTLRLLGLLPLNALDVFIRGGAFLRANYTQRASESLRDYRTELMLSIFNDIWMKARRKATMSLCEAGPTAMMGRACVLAALFFFSMTPRLARAQYPPPTFNPPKGYYLALGDSVAYGFQSFKFQANQPPSAYNTGYVDLFGARLHQIRPGIVTVNYGCPGESTETFVNGPCIWTATGRQLHDAFEGTQLQAAIKFLETHRGLVSPITLTLWGNDLPLLLNPCTVNNQIDLACVQANAPGFIAGLAGRIFAILQKVRSAAPDAEIIVTGAVDESVNFLPFADPLFQAFNTSLREAAAANRARFADPFPVFNPQGNNVAEVQAICTLTLLCVQNDIHPSDAGYQALADLVFNVSEYVRLIQ